MKIQGYNLKGIVLLCIMIPVFSYDELQLVATAESPIHLGDALSIRCGFTGTAGGITTPFIRLYSVDSSGNKTHVAEVTVANGTEDSDPLSTYTVDGWIDNAMTSSSYLQYNQTSVTCGDMMTYECTTELKTSDGTTLYSNASVDAYSDPTDLTAVTYPNKTDYPVGAEVTIMCDGTMGRPEENWFWYKYDTESKKWKPIKSSILQSEAVQVSDCTFKRHSNYTFQITDEKEHMFSCTAGSDVEASLYMTISREASGAEPMMISAAMLTLTILYSVTSL